MGQVMPNTITTVSDPSTPYIDTETAVLLKAIVPQQRVISPNMKVVVSTSNKQVLGKEIILHKVIEICPGITIQIEVMAVETYHKITIQVEATIPLE